MKTKEGFMFISISEAQEIYDRELPEEDIMCDECDCSLSEWELDHGFTTCNECSGDCRCSQCLECA